MTYTEFEKLGTLQQADILHRYGIFLAQRIISVNRIYLYAVSSFYVELFHELGDADSNGIRILRVFEDPAQLDEYLADINISHLYQ